MLQRLQNSVKVFFNTFFTPEEKISCYHCGEKSRKSLTVYIQFEGESRAVCCYGCAAILHTVEELGMHEEYYANKIHIPNLHE